MWSRSFGTTRSSTSYGKKDSPSFSDASIETFGGFANFNYLIIIVFVSKK